jgi:putative membrane protein
MQGFILRFVINVIALSVADALLSGVAMADTATFFIAALVLGLVNAVIRPIAILFTLPATLLTLGLFLWVINAAMLMLVAWLVKGFYVEDFGTAMLGSVIISLTSWMGSWFIGSNGRVEVYTVEGPPRA